MKRLHFGNNFNYSIASRLVFLRPGAETPGGSESADGKLDKIAKKTFLDLDALGDSVQNAERIARGKDMITTLLTKDKEEAKKFYGKFFEYDDVKKEVKPKRPIEIRMEIISFVGKIEGLEDLDNQQKVDAFRAACGSPEDGKVLSSFARIFLDRYEWEDIDELMASGQLYQDERTGKWMIGSEQASLADPSQDNPESKDHSEPTPESDNVETSLDLDALGDSVQNAERIARGKGLITDLLTKDKEEAKKLYGKFFTYDSEAKEIKRKSVYYIKSIISEFVGSIKGLEDLTPEQAREAFRAACGSPKEGKVLSSFARIFLDRYEWEDVDKLMEKGQLYQDDTGEWMIGLDH